MDVFKRHVLMTEVREDLESNQFSAEAVGRALKTISDRLGLDPEVAHSYADDVFCATLRHLGYGAAVDTFDEMDKWYA